MEITLDARRPAFDVGKSRGDPNHIEKLNFILCAYGTTLVRDTGYGGPWDGPRRPEYYCQSPGHNVIILDGLWQKPEAPGPAASGWRSVIDKPLDYEWHTSPNFDYAASVYGEGFLRKGRSVDVKHQRRILFLRPDCWVMNDSLLGQGTRRIESLFHFMPTGSARAGQPGRPVLARNGKALLRIIPVFWHRRRLKVV